MDVVAARKLTNRIYARLNARRPDIDKAENYYLGKQPLAYATKEWMEANASRYAGFSDNWCQSVVSAEAERLKVIGITGGDKDQSRKLWGAFQSNEFDALFSQSVITELTAKRMYAIVWGDDEGKPLLSFEHPASVEVEYDWENPRLRRAALKTWVDESTEYATLYTPHELFKFKRQRQLPHDERQSQAEQAKQRLATDGGWEPRSEIDSEWIVPNPFGVVPVVEFGNRPMLNGDPVSEIEGVMPMQDAINLLWAYLFLSADYASMDARVMLGTSPPSIPILDKETGKPIGSRPVEMKDLREKRLITLTGDNAKIDSWKAASLDIFTDTIAYAVGHISSQTRTPPTYLVNKTGLSNIAADGLKAAEIPLVKKADEFITFTDPALREVCILIGLVLGDGMDAYARGVQFRWASREIRSEAQLADALLKKKSIGYPLEYLLELDGHGPDEIDRIMQMSRLEQESLLGLGVQAVADESFVAGG